uniref:AlNc14C142G7294 protein n=1 Tax=Albugo laibachii Nc14 TaxID=890382 RepID=F0WLA6_9STRA|nr:AlNc14C142G7294 [Albugo laibachii Nc14]|eukprot:CCA22068.1 AlNc14C142G7294 [Albugo laibachii Nc14]
MGCTHSNPTQTQAEAQPTDGNDKYENVCSVTGHSVGPDQVVYYIVQVDDTLLKRRYTDFKTLYANLQDVSSLPNFPAARPFALLMDKRNPEILQERETQFAKIVDAIGKQQALRESEAFQKFLTDPKREMTAEQAPAPNNDSPTQTE